MFTRKLVLALALVAAPGPAGFAGTAEQQQGLFTVPYECGVSAASISLSDTGSPGAAAGEHPNLLTQNSTSRYALQSISVVSPLGLNAPQFTAAIEVFDQGAAPNSKGQGLLKHANKALPANAKAAQAAKANGLKRSQGVTRIELTTTEPMFRAGTYQIVSALTCEQEPD